MTSSVLYPTSAHPGDMAQVVELLGACGLPCQDLTPSHLEAFQVVRDGTELAGVVGLERFANSGLLRSLAVAPAYRGQGLGGNLLTVLESSASHNAISDLYLLTSTAEAFFSKRGYQAVPRSDVPESIQHSAEFTSLCPVSAACMWKRLG